jgi:4-amino-4-deoxy-L-arabinose transferase-like glycosyltransferase
MLKIEKNKIIVILLSLALASRLIFSYLFPPVPYTANTGDIVHYYESAVSLARGEGYVFLGKPTAHFPPGYSFALAPLFKIFFPSYRIAQILNTVLGILSCLFTYGISKKTFGEQAALLTLGIMALSPTNVIWSAIIFSENLFLPLLLGVILLWIHSVQNPPFNKGGLEWIQGRRFYKLLLSGMLLGIASLTRGQAVLLPGVLFFWVLLNKKSLSSSFIAALIVSFFMIVTILPWTIRNKEVLGSFEFISTNTGINLLIGNHPGATGGYHDPEGGYPGGDDEITQNRLCREAALSYIYTHPFQFIKLIPIKIFLLWCADSTFTFRHDLLTKLSPAIGYPLIGAAFILYYLSFMITIIAFMRFRVAQDNSIYGMNKGNPIVILFTLLFIYFSMFHALFFAGPRYNYPFYPFLIVLVTGSIDIWIKNRIRL